LGKKFLDKIENNQKFVVNLQNGKNKNKNIMATITLNLPVEKKLAERIKKYANSRNTTVSNITESFYTVITANDKKTEISPLTQSFSIDGINIPEDSDYKKILAEAKDEKYL
jgi:hypothetical protein